MIADFYMQDFEPHKVIEILSTIPNYDDNNIAVLTRLVAEPVEPSQHRTAVGDVNAGDAGVLDEETPGERTRIAQRPGDGRLDGADVGHDDHD